MRFRSCAIPLFLMLILPALAQEEFANFRVLRIIKLKAEFVLLAEQPSATTVPYVQSAGFTKMIYYPGANFGDYTVTSVDVAGGRVVMSDGTKSIKLLVTPGLRTIVTTELIDLTTRVQWAGKVGDKVAGGAIVSDISDEQVVVKTTDGRHITIPRFSDADIKQLKERKSQLKTSSAPAGAVGR